MRRNVENELNRRADTIDAMMNALQTVAPVLAAARGGTLSSEGDSGLSGTVAEDGTYTAFFAVGMAVGSAPLKPD